MINVCVIFGGASSEYEVSLRSAASVLNNIDENIFNVSRLGITRDGRWLCYNGPVRLIESDKWADSPYARPGIISPDRSRKGIFLPPSSGGSLQSERIRRKLIAGKDISRGEAGFIPVDVVFPVLHGKNGEDGTIQGLLELAGIPYVGSRVLSSAVCMDKEFTHIILERAGIRKTKLIGVKKCDAADIDLLEARLSSELGYPVFVKPANSGSSVGVTKVKQPDELKGALDTAFLYDSKAVVEQSVTGQEIECAVMGNDDPIASSVVGEIAPTHEFYDYEGKYLDDSTNLYVPAHVSPAISEEVRRIAVEAYKAAGCSGLARVDFFVRGDGAVILNEINTIPGFTSISMYARLFEASGVPYSETVTRLINYAIEDF